MLCRECGETLLENARFCTKCGKYVVTETMAPEPESETQSHSQEAVLTAKSPLPTQNDVEKAIAAGKYNYDPESHLYYKCEQAVDIAGKPTTRVVYYDTITMKISQEEYPEGTVQLPEITYQNISFDDISDTTTSIEEIVSPVEEKVRWWRFFVPAVLVVVLAAIIFVVNIGGWYKIIPTFNLPESQPTDWPALPVSGVLPTETSTVELTQSFLDEDPVEITAYRHVIWPDFGHISEVYTDAKEDEKYIYYRPHGSPEIYRIEKETIAVERIMDVSQYGYSEITSFAILDDYLYFNVSMGERSAFFRVHRGGGQAEFIFTDYGGELIEAEDGLFFWSDTEKKMKLFSPYNNIYPIEQAGLHMPALENIKCYSVTPNYVYYSESGNDYELFLRQNRANASPEILLDFKPGEVVNPVIIDENVYFLYFQEEYLLCRAYAGSKRVETLRFLGADIEVPFFAVTQEYIVFKQSDGYYYAPIRYPERSQFMLTTDETPTAVTSEWVLWPRQAYHIKTGRLLDLSRPIESTLFNIELAFKQAETVAGSSEVRNTFLEEPVAFQD